MKTIQLFFVLMIMCTSLFSSAQVENFNNNSTEIKFSTHEIGLRFDDFNGFGFVYKKQKSENKLMRFRFGRVAIGFQDSEPDNQFSFSFGFLQWVWKKGYRLRIDYNSCMVLNQR